MGKITENSGNGEISLEELMSAFEGEASLNSVSTFLNQDEDVEMRAQRSEEVTALRMLSAKLRAYLHGVEKQQRAAGFSWKQVLRHIGRSTYSYLNESEFLMVFRQVARILPQDVPDFDLQTLFRA